MDDITDSFQSVNIGISGGRKLRRTGHSIFYDKAVLNYYQAKTAAFGTLFIMLFCFRCYFPVHASLTVDGRLNHTIS